MRMIAAVTLQAAPSLKEMAHLRLVDALGDSELVLAMREEALLAGAAEALLHELLAQLRLL